MASIQTGIELQDNFTNVLYGIVDAVNVTVSSVDEMSQQMRDVDTSGIENARDEVEQMTAAINEMNAAMEEQNISLPLLTFLILEKSSMWMLNLMYLTRLLKILTRFRLRYNPMHPLTRLKSRSHGIVTVWKCLLQPGLNGFSKKFRVRTIC
ncbi:MAG: hypothetical protein LUH10_05235 [Tannerellaceae bacterium]|nr:hypothetical protein [Tannerellaceae bacterium]